MNLSKSNKIKNNDEERRIEEILAEFPDDNKNFDFEKYNEDKSTNDSTNVPIPQSDSDVGDDEFLKKTKRNIISAIITVVFVLVAIGAVISVVVMTTNDRENDRYNPNQTEQEEVSLATKTLLENNYNLYRMFYEEGLTVSQNVTVDESTLVHNSAGAEEMQKYKIAIDNIYTVDDPTYKTYQQIVDLVNSTLCPEEAEKLLSSGQGLGPVYCDKDGVLGINMNNFQPHEYDKNWSSIVFECKNITDKSADVFVTLPYSDKSDKAGESVTISGNLVKTENGWRLEKLIS